MTHDEFERLIEAIYTAALDRAQWAQVLPRIGDALGGASVLIGVHQAVGRMAWEQTARLDPDCTARFKTQYTQTVWWCSRCLKWSSANRSRWRRFSPPER